MGFCLKYKVMQISETKLFQQILKFKINFNLYTILDFCEQKLCKMNSLGI